MRICRYVGNIQKTLTNKNNLMQFINIYRYKNHEVKKNSVYGKINLQTSQILKSEVNR